MQRRHAVGAPVCAWKTERSCARMRECAAVLWAGCISCATVRRESEVRDICTDCASAHFNAEAGGGTRSTMPRCPACAAPVRLADWAPLAPAAAAGVVERAAAAASVVCKRCDMRAGLVPPRATPQARGRAEAVVLRGLGGAAAEFRVTAAQFYAGRATAHGVVDAARASGVRACAGGRGGGGGFRRAHAGAQ